MLEIVRQDVRGDDQVGRIPQGRVGRQRLWIGHIDDCAAKLIGALREEEIIFTSGGTESNTAAIRAALEIEAYEAGWPGRGKTVLIDDFFNHEVRKSRNFAGDEAWHYKWDE